VVVLAVTTVAWAAEPAVLTSDRRVTQALRLFQEWLDAKMSYEKVPGVSVGLVADGQLIWTKGLGWADIERRVPATSETLYGICSISKLFTAVAVMQLRDQGRLRLDDPVSAHLPYFRLELPPDSPPVTIRALLTHSSGLPRESAHSYWTDPDFAFPTEAEVIAGLGGQQMLYPADRHYQYSNLGIALAGQIVERVSGKSYEDYVRESILVPLNLSHTTPFLPESERGRLLATGYGILTREGTREVMPFYRTGGIAPAAGFASNVVDLASFALWQFRLLEKGGTEVLKASTLREMQRVHWVDDDGKLMRGLGFGVYRQGDVTVVGHTGECPGYYTAIRLDPRRKLAAVVLTNGMGTYPAGIAAQLMTIVGPAVGDAGGEKAPPMGSDPSLERCAGLYRWAWGEIVVVPWQDGLAAVAVPTDDPLGDLMRLKRVEGNSFRRVRSDGDDPGEWWVFEPDADGRIERVRWHQNYLRKVR
jgi:CubicO group peptidase (beta-lactamase class C family)